MQNHINKAYIVSMEAMIVSLVSILNLVISLFCSSIVDSVIQFFKSPTKVIHFIATHIGYNTCENHHECRSILDDVDMILKRLGLGSLEGEHQSNSCKGCMILEGSKVLLEEKQASMEELLQAFTVFDEDRDGLLSPEDLQSVMCKLDIKEGMRIEECCRMIRAYDEDGDDRISFYEFRRMFANVV
ncbi:putative calcium-binding protein CML45 [Acorus gramineus]|uniref:Calcium-binding protein CML45 n=1 Tax=Acorus gramineus TaxID=55184 RepID=A0AAV9BP21_ACOGR|nr:putative calcium-binding protein CML45 [Acorus gramineus]